MIQQYRTENNKGLPSNFNLNGGRFSLVGGEIKAQDNMSVLLCFGNWFRIYAQDFCVDLEWIVQKPTSFIQMYKAIILANFSSAVETYIPYVKVLKINTFYSWNARNDVEIGIEYVYNIDRPTVQQFVTFIN